MNPLVSIVILVKNEALHLRKSIPVILQQNFIYPYEIIVIDSGSTDGSVELIKEISQKDGRVTLIDIQSQEFHHARTRNYGVQLTKGDLVVFLGGDAFPCDNWLRNLVLPVLEGESQGVAASYGKQIPRADADIGNLCRMTFNYGDDYQLKEKGSNLSKKELYFFSSVNCCINKKALSPPYFNDSIPVNEDITLSYRIINSNLKIIYSPAASVIHSHNYSYIEILKRYFDNAITYKKTGIFSNSTNPIANDTITYLKHSINILKNKKKKDWLNFIIFFICAGLGFKLGLNYIYLPKTLCNILSKYGTHNYSER